MSAVALDDQLRALEGLTVRAAELTPGDGQFTLRMTDGSTLKVRVAPPSGRNDCHSLGIRHEQSYSTRED